MALIEDINKIVEEKKRRLNDLEDEIKPFMKLIIGLTKEGVIPSELGIILTNIFLSSVNKRYEEREIQAVLDGLYKRRKEEL